MIVKLIFSYFRACFLFFPIFILLDYDPKFNLHYISKINELYLNFLVLFKWLFISWFFSLTNNSLTLLGRIYTKIQSNVNPKTYQGHEPIYQNIASLLCKLADKIENMLHAYIFRQRGRGLDRAPGPPFDSKIPH